MIVLRPPLVEVRVGHVNFMQFVGFPFAFCVVNASVVSGRIWAIGSFFSQITLILMYFPVIQVSSGTYNRDIVLATLRLVAEDKSGTYHVSGPEPWSKYHWGEEVVRRSFKKKIEKFVNVTPLTNILHA